MICLAQVSQLTYLMKELAGGELAEGELAGGELAEEELAGGEPLHPL